MKYLIVCQDNIGDLVFTSSIINEIRKHETGEAEIHILTRLDTQPVAGFFSSLTSVYSSVALTKINPVTHFSKFRSYLQALKWVKSHRFDVAITVSKNWRLGVLLKHAGVPVRAGFAFPKLKPMLTYAKPLPSLSKPVVESLMELLSGAIGIKTTTTAYALDLDKVFSQREKKLTSAFQIKQNQTWFGLHPFASQVNRCVPLYVWIEVSKFLMSNGLTPVWFGAPSDLDALRKIIKESSGEGVIGYMSDEICSGALDQTIPLLSLCDGYIGHDSGVLHLASAIGLKTLGIFTPGEPERTFAQGIGETRTFHRESPNSVTSSDMIDEIQVYFSEYL